MIRVIIRKEAYCTLCGHVWSILGDSWPRDKPCPACNDSKSTSWSKKGGAQSGTL